MTSLVFSIDGALLKDVDRMADELSITRADLFRIALELALRNQRTIQLEQQHARGYAQHPVEPGEFDQWEPERIWNEK